MTGHIVLIGEMGVGKTTLGTLLAQELRRPFLDSDRVLEATQGASGSDLARALGTPALHSLELETLRAMLNSPQPSVIAAAASVVDGESGRDMIKREVVVWLTANDDLLDGRRSLGDHRRQLDSSEAAHIRERRRPLCSEVASVVIDTGAEDVSKSAARVVTWLDQAKQV